MVKHEEVKLIVEAVAREKGVLRREKISNGIVVFWREDPTLVCDEETQLLMFVWKPWALRK